MSGPNADETAGRGLAAALAAAGHEPPVLVVADTEGVGRLAPAWLAGFDALAWPYRVRVFSGRATPAEIAALAAEARSFGAKTIAAIGDDELIRVAEAAGLGQKISCCAVPWKTPEGR